LFQATSTVQETYSNNNMCSLWKIQVRKDKEIIQPLILKKFLAPAIAHTKIKCTNGDVTDETGELTVKIKTIQRQHSHTQQSWILHILNCFHPQHSHNKTTVNILVPTLNSCVDAKTKTKKKKKSPPYIKKKFHPIFKKKIIN
jgi:hypothetical protein